MSVRGRGVCKFRCRPALKEPVNVCGARNAVDQLDSQSNQLQCIRVRMHLNRLHYRAVYSFLVPQLFQSPKVRTFCGASGSPQFGGEVAFAQLEPPRPLASCVVPIATQRRFVNRVSNLKEQGKKVLYSCVSRTAYACCGGTYVFARSDGIRTIS
jgi:hypothetical protein